MSKEEIAVYLKKLEEFGFVIDFYDDVETEDDIELISFKIPEKEETVTLMQFDLDFKIEMGGKALASKLELEDAKDNLSLAELAEDI